MPSKAEWERREVMITKALLLGYNIALEGARKHDTWFHLQLPDGSWLLHEGLPKAFRARWLAAKHALILAGVIDATKPSGDHRACPSEGG